MRKVPVRGLAPVPESEWVQALELLGAQAWESAWGLGWVMEWGSVRGWAWESEPAPVLAPEWVQAWESVWGCPATQASAQPESG